MDKEKLQKEIVDAISQIAKNEASKNNKITIVKGEIAGVDPLNCYYNFSYNNHLYSARSVLGGYSVGQKVFIAFSGEQENNIILCGEIIGGGTVAGSEERVLSSITQQYYISNSSEIEPPQNPGEGAQYQWSDERLEPTKEASYLWTRYKYTYTDGSVEYSTPYVINVTEAINESNETITDYIDSSIGNIQSQIDKQADIWFYNGVPTLNTYPASEWTTNEIKDIHIGDLYFDTSETSGKAYEFKKNQSTYLWQLVQDQDVIKALNNAAKAQDTADNKRRVFYDTPVPPYDKGDLWVQGSNGDILYCNVPKSSGATYSRSDWVIASKYTDDSNLNIFKEEYTHYKEDNDRKWENTLGKITTIEGQVQQNTSSIQQTAEELSSSVSSINTTIGSLQDQIDGAIETYYLNGTPTLSNEPAVSWTDDETKDTHIGDLYYDKDTGHAYRFMKDGSTYTWVRISDEDISKAFAEAQKANQAAQNAQDDIDNLTEVVNENTTNIQQNAQQIIINAQETTKIRDNLSNNYYTKEQANAAIKTSADNISLSVEKTYTKKEDVEKNVISMVEQFYLSDSPTELSGGSWSSSSPQWQNGKYIWRRTYVAYFDQTSEYTPSEKGVCITGNDGKTGQTGSTGTGISSITVEFYLSTSKITQTGGSWTTTQPTWTSGKYLWTRQKIVYKNPASTVYTTPTCDSSWEAVNEIEVGGRNLVKYSGYGNLDGTNVRGSVATISIDGSEIYKGRNSLKIVQDEVAVSGAKDIWQYLWNNKPFPSGYSKCTISFYVKGVEGAKMFVRVGGGATAGDSASDIAITEDWTKIEQTWSNAVNGDDANTNPTEIIYGFNTVGTYYINGFKLELGNKATDWTPAPEDTQNAIDNAQDAANNAQNTANDNKVNIEANSSKIDILDKSIRSLVVHKDANGEYQSSMIQDETGWHFDITSITNDISKSLTGLNSAAQAIENNNNAIEGVQSDIDDIAAKTAYITISQKDGNPYMELGSTTNAFKLGISNTSIDFMDGTSRVAYISNQNLYIERSIIKNELQIGEGTKFIWKKRANGNLGLRWESE